MRTTVAILLIACLAVASAADHVKITAYETAATCTAGTATTDVTKNLLANFATTNLEVSKCTQIGTTGKYTKFVGTSSAATSFQTFATSACLGGQAVTAATITDATCFALATTNSQAVASGTPSMKITYSTANTNWAALYYSDAACATAVTAADVNKLQAIGATVTQGACTQIGTTGVYYKLVATTTTYTSFKTYADSACTEAKDVKGTSATLAYGSCIDQATNANNADVTPSGQSPQFKLTYVADTTSSKSGSMNLAVSMFALLALILAALF